MGFPQISHTGTYQYRGANESSDFNQIVRDIHCHTSTVWNELLLTDEDKDLELGIPQ
jgi:hypothetical protein